MTLIFNIFVFYTLFNQINCRVINDSFNIFIRITRSFLFPVICLTEMALQVIIIFIGKSPFHIINDGLTGTQWGITIGFSALTFVVSFIAKLIPLETLIDKQLAKNETPDENEDDKKEDEVKEIRFDNKTEEKIKIKNKNIEFDDPKDEGDFLRFSENKQMMTSQNVQNGGKRKSPIINSNKI